MQDRYAGDIGDYGKIGLLKCLKSHGFDIGVNWYRIPTPNMEKRKDGTYKGSMADSKTMEAKEEIKKLRKEAGMTPHHRERMCEPVLMDICRVVVKRAREAQMQRSGRRA